MDLSIPTIFLLLVYFIGGGSGPHGQAHNGIMSFIASENPHACLSYYICKRTDPAYLRLIKHASHRASRTLHQSPASPVAWVRGCAALVCLLL